MDRDIVGEMIRSSRFDWSQAPKSQASPAERQFLHSYVREAYTGDGEIVELGVGGGGTAYAICLGLAENQRVADKSGRVRLFDWYELGPGRFANKVFFRDDRSEEDGNSFLPSVRKNLERFNGAFITYNGDIATVPFDLDRIEILHVDVAKTLSTFQAAFGRFFPHLIPGRSAILHQDFASPSLSWIHYSTAALLPYIEIMSPPIRSTLPFRLVKPIPDEVFRRIRDDDFSVEEKVALIQEIRRVVPVDRSGTLPFEAVLDMSCGFVCHRAGRFDEARKWAEKVEVVPYIREKRLDHVERLKKAN